MELLWLLERLGVELAVLELNSHHTAVNTYIENHWFDDGYALIFTQLGRTLSNRMQRWGNWILRDLWSRNSCKWPYKEEQQLGIKYDKYGKVIGECHLPKGANDCTILPIAKSLPVMIYQIIIKKINIYCFFSPVSEAGTMFDTIVRHMGPWMERNTPRPRINTGAKLNKHILWPNC